MKGMYHGNGRQAASSDKGWRATNGGNCYDQRTSIQNIIHIYNQNFSGPVDYAAAGQPPESFGTEAGPNGQCGATEMNMGVDPGLRPQPGSYPSERPNSFNVPSGARQPLHQTSRATSQRPSRPGPAQGRAATPEFGGNRSGEKLLAGFGEKMELMKGLLRTTEATRQIYNFSKANASLLSFLDQDCSSCLLENCQNGTCEPAVRKNGGMEGKDLLRRRSNTQFTRLSVSLVNALTKKYCRNREDAAEPDNVDLTLA